VDAKHESFGAYPTDTTVYPGRQCLTSIKPQQSNWSFSRWAQLRHVAVAVEQRLWRFSLLGRGRCGLDNQGQGRQGKKSNAQADGR
jgi:hypothetical protein